jgi:hypothetical protein
MALFHFVHRRIDARLVVPARAASRCYGDKLLRPLVA